MENCLVIANKDHEAIAEIVDYEFECAFGADENKITLTIDPSIKVPDGGYIFIDGSEYGGTIDEVKSDSDGLSLSVIGRSWQGILAGKRLLPDSGKAKLSVGGSVAAVLRQLITRMDLDEVFSAPNDESEQVSIDYSFERFIDGYSGLCSMLKASSLKLTFRHHRDKVLLGARPVVDYANTIDSDLMSFEITRIARRTNHLVCGGTGENENRAIVHFYADANGNVSKTQSLFGVDEIEAFYDYSNADESKLEEDGKKKLEEMQGDGTVETSVDEDIDIDIGDIVSAKEHNTGIRVSAEITKKILKISDGVASFEYEAGTASEGTSNSTISGTGESSGGGHAYYAGKGISINNYTINADIDSADLDIVRNKADSACTLASNASAAAGKAQQTADAKADKEHKHTKVDITDFPASMPASDVSDWAKADTKPSYTPDEVGAAPKEHTHNADDLNAGVLPIEHGGTGGNTAKAANYNVMGYSADQNSDATDGGLFLFQWSTPNTTNGAFYTRKGSRVWNWIYSKIKAVLKPGDIGAADSGHTHLYAGAKTVGGAANSATKLATARTITIDGAVKGSMQFDGSKDVTITVTGDSEAAGFLAAHPVGSIYLATSSVNPGTTYGGTWSALPNLNGFAWERIA